MKRIFPDCHRCDQPFDLELEEHGWQLIYCPRCRAAIRREMEEAVMQRVRDEVARMGWPEVIEVSA